MKLYAKGLYRGRVTDILVNGSDIVSLSPSGDPLLHEPSKVKNMEGCEFFPLMIDVHAHLREPGQEYKEGLESGLRAALLGGISRVSVMANTIPPLDSPDMIKALEERAGSLGYAELNVNAAATVGQKGRVPAPFSEYPSSVKAVSDDGHTIADVNVLREVFEKAADAGLVVMSHCENPDGAGYMQSTDETRRRGIPSVTGVDEAIIVKRNIEMAGETGCRLHICHISSVEGLRAVREAKDRGLPVTCEATPHHLFLSVNDIDYSDGFYKVNPPLRTDGTRRALLSALQDGTIDVIATDHAPHAMSEKRLSVEEACYGFSGFDSLFLNLYTHLLEPGLICREELHRLTSLGPAELLSVPPEEIKAGGRASFMVVRKDRYVLKEEDIISRGKNNPFVGREFTCRIEMVVKDGREHRRRYAS